MLDGFDAFMAADRNGLVPDETRGDPRAPDIMGFLSSTNTSSVAVFSFDFLDGVSSSESVVRFVDLAVAIAFLKSRISFNVLLKTVFCSVI